MNINEMIAREAVRKTAALYTRAVDSRRYAELRDVFFADAIVAVHGGAELRGVEQIITAFEAGAEKRSAATPGNFQRHNLTTAMIEQIDSDHAEAIHYVLVVTELGFDHAGTYRDMFRRRGDKWLIAKREARMEWVCPESRFAAWLGQASPATAF
jgi:dsRNA-specific ribonuclease